MKKSLPLLALSLLALSPVTAANAAFSTGTLVVSRLGNGVSTLSSAAAPIYLDEFTITGTNQSPLQSIALPTTVSGNNHAITNSGSATSEGALTLSADSHYLTIAGYDAAPGTASVVSTTSANNPRVIARIDADGNIVTSVALSDAYSGNNIRSVVSTDGATFYTSGTASGTNGGVRYVSGVSATSSTFLSASPTNVRVANIFNGQLYISSSSGSFVGISSVGDGLPAVGGQTTTLLPGFGSGTGKSPSSYDFFLVDSNSDNAPDIAYVADDSTNGSDGGLQKWMLNGTTWTREYVLASGLTANTGLRGLTASISDGVATFYAITGEGSANHLVTIADTLTDTALPATAFTVLATAPSNEIFRGVDFSPAPVVVPEPASLLLLTTGVAAVMLKRRTR